MSKVAPDCYATFIMDCLRNPTELWKDEFTRKLGAEDQALLLTLYSLTDTRCGGIGSGTGVFKAVFLVWKGWIPPETCMRKR